MYGPKKQDKDDDDYDEKTNKMIDTKIRNLQDIKDALPDNDPIQEKLDNQIQNLKDAK